MRGVGGANRQPEAKPNVVRRGGVDQASECCSCMVWFVYPRIKVSFLQMMENWSRQARSKPRNRKSKAWDWSGTDPHQLSVSPHRKTIKTPNASFQLHPVCKAGQEAVLLLTFNTRRHFPGSDSESGRAADNRSCESPPLLSVQ